MCNTCWEAERNKEAEERNKEAEEAAKQRAKALKEIEAESIEWHRVAKAKREEENRLTAKGRGPICKLCGSKYSIWTADLVAGLCNACSQELAAIENAKRNNRAEAATPKPEASQAALSAPTKENVLFYYKVKDAEKGPYTLGQLRSMWDNGLITADAVSRSSDSSEWLPLLSRFSESKPTSDAPIAVGGAPSAVTATPTEQRPQKAKSSVGKESASNAKKWGLGFAGVVVLIIVGVIFGPSHSSNNSSPSSGHSTSNKSARQLIREYAESQHGRRADIDIESGFAGGAYTVTVSDHENFHTYTYAVEVDEAAQRVTAWQLTASH
jgi:hypothetical protein